MEIQKSVTNLPTYHGLTRVDAARDACASKKRLKRWHCLLKGIIHIFFSFVKSHILAYGVVWYGSFGDFRDYEPQISLPFPSRSILFSNSRSLPIKRKWIFNFPSRSWEPKRLFPLTPAHAIISKNIRFYIKLWTIPLRGLGWCWWWGRAVPFLKTYFLKGVSPKLEKSRSPTL